jgi:hypothetical protein
VTVISMIGWSSLLEVVDATPPLSSPTSVRVGSRDAGQEVAGRGRVSVTP